MSCFQFQAAELSKEVVRANATLSHKGEALAAERAALKDAVAAKAEVQYIREHNNIGSLTMILVFG